jgi:AcrR family transcriptional regulator
MFPIVPAVKRTHKREAHQLPPGRHGLARSFVVQNQKDRILAAVADVTSAAGYAAMSVEDIIVTAGVSRRTFYDHFRSKEEAFLASYDAIAAQLAQRVLEAFNANHRIIDRAREGLRTFLEFVASEPTFADMCIVEVLAAGPEAVERRNRAMNGFASLIEAAASDSVPKSALPPQLTAETIVGGIYEVVYSRVLQGRTAELPLLLPDLLYSMLLPYIGHDAAKAEYTRERRRLRRATAPARR